MSEAPAALQQAVSHAFARGGALAQADAHYVEREVQQRMARAVAEAIAERRVLVAEAGTGVGKTFAYLVPALLSGARALISTATKSLQDQLFLRDLPRLRDALQVPVSLALLKGRASYLCVHRMGLARQGAQLPDRWAVRALAKIEQWSRVTNTGDLAEMQGLDERSSVIPLVTSSRENCLGSDCAHYRDCHVMKARRDAMAADVVVINHHLFFADMALRESGVAELLPSVDVAIFDEAHQLAEAGVQFLGTTLGSAQLIDFARDAEFIERQTRAFAPAPGAWFEFEGERYRILSAHAIGLEGYPATVLDERLTIACGHGAIRPLRIQRAGKPAMDTADLLRGKPIPPGTVIR